MRYLYLLLLILLSSATPAGAQWLKKIPSSDNLYREAKEETEKKNYPRALYLARTANDITPKDLDIRLLLGRLYMLTNKPDSARMQFYYIVEKNPKYKDAFTYLVNMDMTDKNYERGLLDVNRALKYYPNDKDYLLKKYEILNNTYHFTEAAVVAEELLNRYPHDTFVRSVFIDQKFILARDYARRGNFDQAKAEYRAILQADPSNKEALDAIFNINVRSGDYESSLAYVNWALQTNPNSYEFLYKKVGILQEMLRYADAITVAQQMLQKYPNDEKVRQLNVNLRMEAGRYYMNTDPYLQFQGVLEKQPSNREALNYVINIAISRGLYSDALQWVNQALRYNAGDQQLLLKKVSVLEQLRQYGAASDIAEKLYRSNRTNDNKERFVDLTIQSGRQFLGDMQYDSALYAFKRILAYDPVNESALNYAVSVYTAQKDYDEALNLVDEALSHNPRSEQLLFKKAGILESYGKYEEALAITGELSDRYPDNRKYSNSFIDQSLAAARISMQYNDYVNAINKLRTVLQKRPDDKEALNYMINMQTAVKSYDSALYYINNALVYYPDSRDFLIKKSSILSDNKQFAEAYTISKQLYETYPYNTQYKTTYIDQLLASGRNYQQLNFTDSALANYNEVLRISPTDTNALLYTINIYNDSARYDSALALIERGRVAYPDKQAFLLKKAVVLENMKDYQQAALAADTLMRMNTNNLANKDYASYLYSRTLKNEISLFFLRSTYDDPNQEILPAHIATIQYLRHYKRGTIAGRVNYAGRVQGTGFQFDLESFYNHSSKWYSYGVATFSNTIVFPKLRLGYSLFHAFNKGWEGEIGGRYLYADSFESISLVGSVTKSISDFWINLRGYAISFDNDMYWSAQLTSRYYISDVKTDYFSLIAGYGTPPDDRSRNFNFGEQVTYTSVIVGAGFQKAIKYRTIFSINASWINQKINPTDYRNQYDLYLMLTRKF